MNKIIGLILVGALCWPAMSEAGSVGKISGTVRDARGEPLPGANVVVRYAKRCYHGFRRLFFDPGHRAGRISDGSDDGRLCAEGE